MLKGLFASIYLTLFALFLASCNTAPKRFVTIEGEMLGTSYNITAELPMGGAAVVQRRAKELDKRMKSEMSIFDPTSQLSRINRGESDITTPWIEANIRLADSISRLSGGLYDITCAPLVEAWGFVGGRPNRESEPNIDSLLQFVGYEGITIENGRIIKRDKRMQIDLNSIAKGFAVDRLAEIVEQIGAENYIVDIGGELHLAGTNPSGSAWRIGIETPIDGNMTDGEFLQQRVAVESDNPLRGMATSGNYRRFHLAANGEKIVHTINPLTGRAESSTLLSVTVIARNCAEADALATMLLAAGDERAEELAASIKGCEIYLIYSKEKDSTSTSDYRVVCSDGMKRMLLD